MNIGISLNDYNTNLIFSGRRPKFSKEELTKILVPLVDSNLPVKELMKKTGISRRIIEKWFDDNYGTTAAKLYRNARKNKLRTELIELRDSGKSNAEIAESLGQTKRWVDKQLYKLKATRVRTKRSMLMQENIPWMLEAGYTIERIHDALQVGKTTISNWIKKYYTSGVVRFRKQNNINIWRDIDNKRFNFKQNFISFFKNGGTITEATKLFDMSPASVFRWLKIFNIKTDKQQKFQKLDENLMECIDKKMNVTEIAKEYGVSPATVTRKIKKITGKYYRDIKSVHKS